MPQALLEPTGGFIVSRPGQMRVDPPDSVPGMGCNEPISRFHSSLPYTGSDTVRPEIRTTSARTWNGIETRWG